MKVFGNVWGAAGVEGFYGEGYWFHLFLKIFFGLNFKGMTFVSKTITLPPRKGNVKTGIWEAIFPCWARLNFLRVIMLNAMGLPNDGIEACLEKGLWQLRKKPFLISIASVQKTPEARLQELQRIVEILAEHLDEFLAPIGIQINLSCPNTGHDLGEIIAESEKALEIASVLNVPLIPKYSIASAPIHAIKELGHNPHCQGICVSNTLPFGWQGIDWKKVWGSKVSPLQKFGGGGLSGKDLLPLVCGYIKRLRDAGFEKYINGGGGILCPRDVNRYHNAGASSCFVGAAATLRSQNVVPIIERANQLTWRNSHE